MKLNDEEISILLSCINERLVTISAEVIGSKKCKINALKSKSNDMAKIITACDNVIKSHIKEYSELISIETKLKKAYNEEIPNDTVFGD